MGQSLVDRFECENLLFLKMLSPPGPRNRRRGSSSPSGRLNYLWTFSSKDERFCHHIEIIMYSFMYCFSKLEHMTYHMKAKKGVVLSLDSSFDSTVMSLARVSGSFGDTE